jgi:3-hydroxybutyryl-CoA dehydratase
MSVAQTSILEPGTELRAPGRRMTRERMRWYCDAHDTVIRNDGIFHIAPPNIHNSDEFARGQGLPAIIADGMISTNWIYSFLIDQFGEPFLERGALRTKYTRPVYEDEVITIRARVKAVTAGGDGTRACMLDVWCENDTGQPVTVGEATVYLPAG